MLAITVFWIVAFSVMIYFMIKEWNSLSRATRAKVRTRTAVQLDPDARSPRSRSVSTKPTPDSPVLFLPTTESEAQDGHHSRAGCGADRGETRAAGRPGVRPPKRQ